MAYLTEYSKNNKLIYLPEKNVILITENEIKLIGKTDYIIFQDGKYEYHNKIDNNIE